MQPSDKSHVDVSQNIFALRHIESGEYICLRHEGAEYLACFTDGDTAFQFREELNLLEYVDITSMRLGSAPFDRFWLDGEMTKAPSLTEA